MGLLAQSEGRMKGRSREGGSSSTAYLTPVLRGRLQALLLLTLSRGHPGCPARGVTVSPGTPHPPQP